MLSRRFWGQESKLLRVLVILGGLVAALGSAGSSKNANGPRGPQPASQAPESQPMQAEMALGVWKSNFGPVKLEFNPREPGQVMGVWVYDKQGQEVIGYFAGYLSGNVLNYNWQEPAQPPSENNPRPQPLRGSGYLQFDANGRTFNGQWWTDDRSRSGNWNGWRAADAMPSGGGQGVDDGVPSTGQPQGPAEPAPGPPPGNGEYL